MNMSTILTKEYVTEYQFGNFVGPLVMYYMQHPNTRLYNTIRIGFGGFGVIYANYNKHITTTNIFLGIAYERVIEC